MRNLVSVSVLAVATIVVARASPASALSQDSTASQHQSIRGGMICGWFINPTPGNMWLDTASAEWTIGLQGGFQAKGNRDWPRFAAGQWVQTNGGGYGYGCACLRGELNETTKYVDRISSIKALALHVCRQNPALRAKEPPAP